jgi:hypothetical protein
MGSVTSTEPNIDSATTTKLIFDRFFEKEISYPSNQVDAVIGFFVKRGFEQQAAISVGTVLLQQSKVDQINVLELLDSLKSFDKVKLSNLVSAILNSNRSKISKLGYKTEANTNNLEARNILY